ncbi:MAG: VTT domain-containing protein [Chloroflexi bacterium]|nr:VTT domain-containing protein [Chloroflexota bacterium]
MLAWILGPLANFVRRYDWQIRIVSLVLGIGLILSVWFLRDTFEVVQRLETLGYRGVLIVAFLSFLGSVALVLPVPGLASLCAVSAIINPALVGVAAAGGETLGEISGYAIGFGGRSVIENSRFYPTFQSWMEKRGWLVIFIVALIPNPFFDIVGIAAGATRYPAYKFFPIVLVGKVIKGIVIGYTCHWLPWGIN